MKVLVFLLVVAAAQAYHVLHTETAKMPLTPRITQVFGNVTYNSDKQQLLGVDFASKIAKSNKIVETIVQFPSVSYPINESI